MKLAKVISGLGVLAMTAALYHGFFAGALYVLLALNTSKGSWQEFFMGASRAR